MGAPIGNAPTTDRNQVRPPPVTQTGSAPVRRRRASGRHPVSPVVRWVDVVIGRPPSPDCRRPTSPFPYPARRRALPRAVGPSRTPRKGGPRCPVPHSPAVGGGYPPRRPPAWRCCCSPVRRPPAPPPRPTGRPTPRSCSNAPPTSRPTWWRWWSTTPPGWTSWSPPGSTSTTTSPAPRRASWCTPWSPPPRSPRSSGWATGSAPCCTTPPTPRSGSASGTRRSPPTRPRTGRTRRPWRAAPPPRT